MDKKKRSSYDAGDLLGKARRGTSAFWKAIATIIVWVAVAGIVVTLGVTASGVLQEAIIAPVIVTLVMGMLSMGFIWNWGRYPGEVPRSKEYQQRWGYTYDEDDEEDSDVERYLNYGERRKVDRLSAALRHLSDAELTQLRERIADGSLTDRELEALLRRELD